MNYKIRGSLIKICKSACIQEGVNLFTVFFSEEENQESIRMEDLAPEGAMISNQALEEEISKMVVIKWSDKVEGSGDNIDPPLCGGLYKEEDNSLVPW